MLTAYGATDKGCVRANNEDTFLVEQDLGLYLVADGMGEPLQASEPRIWLPRLSGKSCTRFGTKA